MDTIKLDPGIRRGDSVYIPLQLKKSPRSRAGGNLIFGGNKHQKLDSPYAVTAGENHPPFLKNQCPNEA
jgi:hypothetical protein